MPNGVTESPKVQPGLATRESRTPTSGKCETSHYSNTTLDHVLWDYDDTLEKAVIGYATISDEKLEEFRHQINTTLFRTIPGLERMAMSADISVLIDLYGQITRSNPKFDTETGIIERMLEKLNPSKEVTENFVYALAAHNIGARLDEHHQGTLKISDKQMASLKAMAEDLASKSHSRGFEALANAFEEIESGLDELKKQNSRMVSSTAPSM